MHFWLRNILLGVCLVIIVLVNAQCGDEQNKDAAENKGEARANVYLNHTDTARYVGINTCRLCHADIYESYIQTGMGQSFDLASKAKSAGRFGKNAIVYDKFSDFYYHPFWEGDSMKIMEFRLEGRDTVYRRIETVNYIVGSGQHTNSHIFNTNGYLHQMPVTYYTQREKWDLPPGFENGFNTRFSRNIGLECMSCHNAFPGFVVGSENKYEIVPAGIDCERCHGPGSIHVQQKSAGVVIDTSTQIDYSIVNPGKLPVDLQFDVCQRCHLQGNAVLKEGRSFFDYRPGMKLSDVISVFMPKYKGAEDEFIMASHADRLKMSPCFIESFKPGETSSLRPYKEALTCVTCHNPHVSVKVTGDEVFNKSCNNCHGNKVNEVCTEKKEVRMKVNDNCVSCHMPKSGSIDIPHVSVTDHYIRKPMKKEEVKKVKEFLGLYSINDQVPSAKVKAKAYIQQFEKFNADPVLLDSARKYLPSGTSEELWDNLEMLIHLDFVRKDYPGMLKRLSKFKQADILARFSAKSLDNAHAWAAYRVGEAYQKQGFINEAFVYYQRANELAPYNPDFKNKLAGMLVSLNRHAEAKRYYEEIIKEDPKFAPAYCNLGYVMLLTGDPAKAEQLYDSALALDPDYELALMNKAGLYAFQKKYVKALEYVNLVLKKNPKNQQAMQVKQQLEALK
jgi:tetratricopeptide (TPR) repeat protein